MFQSHYLLAEFNALENAMLPARINELSLAVTKQKTKDLLAKVGLKDRKDHFQLAPNPNS